MAFLYARHAAELFFSSMNSWPVIWNSVVTGNSVLLHNVTNKWNLKSPTLWYWVYGSIPTVTLSLLTNECPCACGWMGIDPQCSMEESNRLLVLTTNWVVVRWNGKSRSNICHFYIWPWIDYVTHPSGDTSNIPFASIFINLMKRQLTDDAARFPTVFVSAEEGMGEGSETDTIHLYDYLLFSLSNKFYKKTITKTKKNTHPNVEWIGE